MNETAQYIDKYVTKNKIKSNRNWRKIYLVQFGTKPFLNRSSDKDEHRYKR